MKIKLISCELAELLKDKGFNEECSYIYNEDKEIEKLNYYGGDGSGVTTNNSETYDRFKCEDMLCTACTLSEAQE